MALHARNNTDINQIPTIARKGNNRGGKRAGSGRKTRKEEIKDFELHKRASSYLFNNFHKFSEEKKLDIAIKIINKFGVSKLNIDNKITIDNNQRELAIEYLNNLTAKQNTARLN